jgi:integrase
MKTSVPKGASGRKALSLFRPEETSTLEDAIKSLLADPHLPPVRQRDLASSLRRVAAAIGRPPSQVPAELQWLHQKLAAEPAMRLGRSPKTRANVLSNAVAALAHAGVAARRPAVVRTPEWEALWTHLAPSAKIALGSFARFCSFHQIEPANVTDSVVREYREAIVLSSLRKKPEEAIRDLAVHWNRARDEVPGCLKQQLTVPSRRVMISPAIEDLPVSFREDLERYISRIQKGDLLAADGAPPLAAATIKSRRLQIRRFFGELVASGVRPEEIRDLASMVRPELAYRGLTAMLDRKGAPSGMIHGMAYTLLVIAKHHARLSDEEQQQLRTACSRLKVQRRGMTAKNRARLRQFDDPQVLHRLLCLPEELLREARTKALSPPRAGTLVEVALAIELLLMTALRIKNLSTLHLDKNIQWQRSSLLGICHLVVDGRDVKNGEDRDFELEGATVTLLKLYIERFRPSLATVSCRWLFARRDGAGPVDPVVLANRIKRTIRKRTGLTVNVHLFRSLGAKIYLDQNPGGYEVVRRVLGHRHLSTTTAAYTGMESVSAAKQFDQTIRKSQEQALSQRRRSSARAW